MQCGACFDRVLVDIGRIIDVIFRGIQKSVLMLCAPSLEVWHAFHTATCAPPTRPLRSCALSIFPNYFYVGSREVLAIDSLEHLSLPRCTVPRCAVDGVD